MEQSTGSEAGGTAASSVDDSKAVEQPPITGQSTVVLIEKLDGRGRERCGKRGSWPRKSCRNGPSSCLREEMFVSQAARSALFPR